MEENNIKKIIKRVNLSDDDEQIIRDYEQTVKMFDDLVELGVAEKGKTVLLKNSSVIKFDLYQSSTFYSIDSFKCIKTLKILFNDIN